MKGFEILVKIWFATSIKDIIYELQHELPNHFRVSTLGNTEIWEKF